MQNLCRVSLEPDTSPTPHLRTIRINQANQHRSRTSNRWGGDQGLALRQRI
jgi:hypothetical protein